MSLPKVYQGGTAIHRRKILGGAALLTLGGLAGRTIVPPQAEAVLRPEFFGRVGISPAGDTAAWVALAREARAQGARSGRVVVQSAGDYDIVGSAVTFSGIPDLRLDLAGSRFRQRERLSRTLQFLNCPVVSVVGGEGYGLGRQGFEYDGSRPTYNGVAFLYFEECDAVTVTDSKGFDHGGGCFVVRGGRLRRFTNVQAVGIGVGPGGIPDPLETTDPDLRNGSDFGISCVPINANRGWIYDDEFINCQTRDSAFGIQTVQTARCYGRGNRIGPHPGQHGVYGVDLDGVDWQTNTFQDCAQLAFKNQLENYAGRFIGDAWEPGASYVAGQKVRFSSTLWEVSENHRAGARPDASRLRKSALNTRGAGIFANNTARRCQSGFAQIAVESLYGSSLASEGWRINNNLVEDSTGESLRLDRMLDCEVMNNAIRGSVGTAILALDFSGAIRGNSISTAQVTAINVLPLGPVRIEDNELINVALNGSDEQGKTPVVISGPGIMSSRIRPRVTSLQLSRNTILWGGRGPNGRVVREPVARWLYLVGNRAVVVDAADLVSDPLSPRTFSIPTPAAMRSTVRNRFSGFTNNTNARVVVEESGRSD